MGSEAKKEGSVTQVLVAVPGKIAFNVPRDVFRKVKVRCVERGQTFSEYFLDLLRGDGID